MELMTLLPLVLLIVIMYFLLIRPQKKREKAVNEMRGAIKVGDDIITIGGIYGKVVKVRDEQLTIQVGADKTKFEVTRWAISKVINDQPVEKGFKSGTSKDKGEEEEAPKQKKPKRLGKSESDEAAETNVTKEEDHDIETSTVEGNTNEGSVETEVAEELEEK